MVVIVNRVIELPIRDGNNIIEECLKFNKRVIELPIRDGNSASSGEAVISGTRY